MHADRCTKRTVPRSRSHALALLRPSSSSSSSAPRVEQTPRRRSINFRFGCLRAGRDSQTAAHVGGDMATEMAARTASRTGTGNLMQSAAGSTAANGSTTRASRSSSSSRGESRSINHSIWANTGSWSLSVKCDLESGRLIKESICLMINSGS